MKPEALLILTHRDANGEPRAPHTGAFEASNPGVPWGLVVSEETGESSEVLWRNGDRVIPEWWRANAATISGDVIALAEWDTLITCAIPHLPDDLDMVGRVMRRRGPAIDPSVNPFGIPLTHLKPRQRVPGPSGFLADIHLGSFGFLIVRRWVLDAVSKPEWAAVYAMDIRNEVRTPSIAYAEGARIGTIQLPGVFYKGDSPPLGTPGIYHPVKLAAPPA